MWNVASPDAQLVIATNSPVTEDERELAGQFERMAGFYVRNLVREAPADHSSLVEGPYVRLRFATEVISSARAGHIAFWRPEWENETVRRCECLLARSAAFIMHNPCVLIGQVLLQFRF